ncbi:hypothetical protein Acsp06_56560 [Actinomycetospora sp. NBRC 106375]|nr:hypothetical protein Acsp06_56560 [Actinomycetospora sp. NBRC 106375]
MLTQGTSGQSVAGAPSARLRPRDFARERPNQLWVTDPTREGKVLCAVVLDMYSRRLVGWSSLERTQQTSPVGPVVGTTGNVGCACSAIKTRSFDGRGM